VAGGVSLGASDCAKVGGGPRYGRSSPIQEGAKGVPAWYKQGPACRGVSGGVVGVLEQGECVCKVGGVWKREGGNGLWVRWRGHVWGMGGGYRQGRVLGVRVLDATRVAMGE
jgi:hypothetical protein